LINNVFISLNEDSLEQTSLTDAYLNDAEQALINAKTEFTYLWSLAELQKIGSQEERGRWQTQFAEITIDYALRVAWLSIAVKHKVLLNVLQQNNGHMPGLFIFGMGKLEFYLES